MLTKNVSPWAMKIAAAGREREGWGGGVRRIRDAVKEEGPSSAEVIQLNV